MKYQNKIYMILFLFCTFLVMSIYNFKAQQNLQTEIKSFEKFFKEGSNFVDLQNSWQSKSGSQKRLSQIQRIIKPTKQTTIKDIKTLYFKNLSKEDIRRIGKLLLNSKLNIQKLELNKTNKTASLKVEVKL